MSWTNEETAKFQSENNQKLAEINATLRPDSVKGSGKIGIFLPGQVGDLATAMSVLKYRKELWGDKEIVWFANYPNADLLRYAPISEVRPWLWAGNGLPEGCPDFYPMLCDENNRLNKELAQRFPSTADLDDGYFPAPHQMTPEQRRGLDYPNVSRKVFGIGADREWHPVLSWSREEGMAAKLFEKNFSDRRNIMLETYFGSGQSMWTDEMTDMTIKICREKWGECNFLFASHKGIENFIQNDRCLPMSVFTPRQVAQYINYCDLFVGVSSGISVVTSAWGLKPVPKIQFCGSQTCSTVALSTGEISLITTDGLGYEHGKRQFENKLKEVISRIQ